MSALRAGAARVVIPSPLGQDLTGFIARDNPAVSVLDPLYARALALECGGQRLLILSLDCLGLDAALVAHLRSRISYQTKLPAEAITLACSHTHSGPATIFLQGCGERNRLFLRTAFTHAVVEAVRRATAALVSARAAWSVGDAPGCNRYRRARDPRADDAPLVDTRVKALWLESLRGTPLAVLWSYAAHPTWLCARQISAEWPGVTAGALEDAWGGVAVFAQGCAGDVAPAAEGAPTDPLAAMRAMGEQVAAIALRSRGEARPLAIDALSARARPLLMPLEPAPSREELRALEAEQRALAARLAPGPERRAAAAMADWAATWLTRRAPRTRIAMLGALQLGELTIATLPFEPLSALGRDILNGIGEPAMVWGYANGCHAYLAPARQYPVGGYEIDTAYKYFGLPARYASGAAELVVKTAVGMFGPRAR